MKRRRVVVENFARLIDPEVRAELGIETAAESIQKAVAKSEKAEHKIFTDWCKLNDVPCRTDRMDRRITGSVGWPDFLVIVRNMVWPLELKVGNNKLSPEQKEVAAQLERNGTEVNVCYSADQAIRKLKGWLWENFRWEPKH